MKFRLHLLALLVPFLLTACGQVTWPLPWPPRPAAPEVEPEPVPEAMEEPEPEADPRVELLWDEWGVPHIFADDAAALFYGNGWAMMHSHGNLVLRLYGQARGRAAEYWGERFLDSDVWVRTNGIPERASRWLDEQVPHARAWIESFVAGMNMYAERNPDAIAPEWQQVLPVTAEDVLAHQQRVLNFTFLANPAMVTGTARAWQADAGSNAWAIGPSRSATGNALLLINPHLPWGDLFTFYELHLSTPDVNAYGATLVGFPGIGMGFNEHLGWAHTVNTIDSADIYELVVEGDSYVLDGVAYALEVDDQLLRIRQPDGTMTERALPIRRSVHGPIVAQREGRALALRVAGLDSPNLLAQLWDMARATNRASFEVALSRLQLPMFTVMYADRSGDIMHVFNGAVPLRGRGDWNYWQGIVPGDSSATLWTRVHDYNVLPRIVNPGTGWLQNANDPPWTTTFPQALSPTFFPPYVAPERPLAFRPMRSARMLAETSRMTLERMIELKHSTRMQAADHLVSDVVAAARSLELPGSREAAGVLETWDRNADAGSRGAVLFAHFYRAMAAERWPSGSMFEIPWTPAIPFGTPEGLAHPRRAVELLVQAAAEVSTVYGSLDVAWGDVHRLRLDDVDLPANGGGGELGIFRVVAFEPVPGDASRQVATSGDSFIAAIEFGDSVRARVLTVYGNSTQPGSPHRTDQLGLFARKELRPVRMTRDEVLPHVTRRDAF
ncbi:MAG TPA: acylase [Longimicrobiales bacterium]|nr:acylase [Longimicrobiales bacterium]